MKKKKEKVFVVPVVHETVFYAVVKAPDRKTAIEAALDADNNGLYGDECCDFEDHDSYIDEKNVEENESFAPDFIAVKSKYGPGYTLEPVG